MLLVSKSEPRSTECSLEMVFSIDEKHGIVEFLFLSEFLQEPFCQRGCGRRIQPCMEDFVRSWINSSVQPITIIVKLNHCFVERDVIRHLIICRLEITVVNPIVDHLSTVFDTEFL